MQYPIQRRSIATCIILSFVTCGIYYYYWLYKVACEIESSDAPDRTGMSPGLIVLLSVVSCTLFGIYVFFKWGKAVQQVLYSRGVPAEDRSTIYLILSILGLDVVNMALIQDDLNKIATV